MQLKKKQTIFWACWFCNSRCSKGKEVALAIACGGERQVEGVWAVRHLKGSIWCGRIKHEFWYKKILCSPLKRLPCMYWHESMSTIFIDTWRRSRRTIHLKWFSVWVCVFLKIPIYSKTGLEGPTRHLAVYTGKWDNGDVGEEGHFSCLFYCTI